MCQVSKLRSRQVEGDEINGWLATHVCDKLRSTIITTFADVDIKLIDVPNKPLAGQVSEYSFSEMGPLIYYNSIPLLLRYSPNGPSYFCVDPQLYE